MTGLVLERCSECTIYFGVHHSLASLRYCMNCSVSFWLDLSGIEYAF